MDFRDFSLVLTICGLGQTANALRHHMLGLQEQQSERPTPLLKAANGQPVFSSEKALLEAPGTAFGTLRSAFLGRLSSNTGLRRWPASKSVGGNYGVRCLVLFFVKKQHMVYHIFLQGQLSSTRLAPWADWSDVTFRGVCDVTL